MKKRLRLRRRGQIQEVLRSRRVLVSPTVVAYARPAPSEGRLRVAVAVSRNLKGAVRRSRARRRLREAARAGLLAGGSDAEHLGIGYDVVVIARPPALDVAFTELVATMETVRRRLGESRMSGGG